METPSHPNLHNTLNSNSMQINVMYLVPFLALIWMYRVAVHEYHRRKLFEERYKDFLDQHYPFDRDLHRDASLKRRMYQHFTNRMDGFW